MGIENFPAALVPIIQQNYLEREFQDALRSRLAYRAVAERIPFSVGIGETLTKTRPGLRATVTTPMNPSTNTNLDNGITPGSTTVEQYTLTINQYGASVDLNTVTSRVGIVGQFLLNAKLNGEQAARSLDELARNALFAPYFGGNTRVSVTLIATGTAMHVDDIRGFTEIAVNGQQTPVSATATMTVTVNVNNYTLVGAAPDASNVSTAPNGISGVLTFSGDVTVADGTLGNTVTAANASNIVRPGGRANTSLLQAGDSLTMATLLNGVALLRQNAVPEVDGGAYNCYLDPVSARQLFSDSDFRQLFQGVAINEVFARGELAANFLGLRFVPTTEAFIQQAGWVAAGTVVRRPIIVGAGALVEGTFAGMMDRDVAPKDSLISVIDGVAMVTREPLDRMQQIIAQSWYWIGGYSVPTDLGTNPTTVPTATNAAFKRAVMIEHIG